MHRDLYLVAYDIRDERRLHRVHEFVVGYATGGQKSVYECFLTEAERREIEEGLAALMDLSKDRAHLLHLRTNCAVTKLGVAVRPQNPTFYFVGV